MRLLPLMLIFANLIAAQTPVEKEIVSMERQFFAAWQNKSLDAVENNIAAEGVSWSEWGTLDKAAQVANQKSANANCTVRSWDMKDIRLLAVSSDSFLLMYTASQDAQCGGSSAPTPVSNSSLWVWRNGSWMNLYRASVVPRHTAASARR